MFRNFLKYINVADEKAKKLAMNFNNSFVPRK
jgi:hypothetical protein